MLDIHTLVTMITTTKSDFSAVQMPREVIARLDEFSKSEIGRNMGITNKAQAAKAACLEFLEKYGKKQDPPIRFVLPSLKDDKMRLDIHIYSDHVECNRCEKSDCFHIDLLYNDKEVRSSIKKSKIILPEKNSS